MKAVVIKYGVISGVIIGISLMITFILSEQLHLGHSVWVGYATMVAGFAVVYFGVRAHRDNYLGGRISFGAALKTALLISLITCTFYVAAWEIMYFGGMVPNFEKSYSESVITSARAEGATQAEIDAKTAEMKKWFDMYKNPLVNIAFTYAEPLPLALLASFISAIALSRKRGVSLGTSTA